MLGTGIVHQHVTASFQWVRPDMSIMGLAWSLNDEGYWWFWLVGEEIVFKNCLLLNGM